MCDHEDKFLLNASLVDIEQLGCVGNPADAELVADDSGWCGPEVRLSRENTFIRN